GCSVVFISHRLKEVMEICDNISILRDGKCVSSGTISEYTPERLVAIMSDTSFASSETVEQQEALRAFAAREIEDEAVVKAKSVTVGRAVDVSFELRKGEVFGVAGLGGSGAEDVLNALFGLSALESGEFEVAGQVPALKNPIAAIRAGIGYVPEDRQLAGEFLEMSVSDNVCIAEAQSHSYASTINSAAEIAATHGYIRQLAIKAHSPKVPIKNLSGGNQQKAIIAKWLRVNSRILILNEPTSGIDVHAKKEVFKIIMEIARAGKSILYTTSDISELTSMADRIAVVYNGKLVRIFDRSEFDNGKIHLAMNGILDAKGK
ncbi:MAG: ATP-binding cassette domain-containing protein, partial [Marinosulfonomonas sp.]